MRKEKIIASGGGGYEFAPGGEYEEKRYPKYDYLGDVRISGSLIQKAADDLSLPKKMGKEETNGYIVRDGDVITTGNNGYVFNLEGPTSTAEGSEDEKMSITIYPNSEAKLTVRNFKRQLDKTVDEKGTVTIQSASGCDITSVELVRGLFFVSLSTKKRIEDKLIIPSRYPLPEFGPMSGKFGKVRSVGTFIYLEGNKTTLFSFMNSITHKGTGQTVDYLGLMMGNYGIMPKNIMGKYLGVKITLAPDGLYITDLMKNPDPFIEAVFKRQDAMIKYLMTRGMPKAAAEYSKYSMETMDAAEKEEETKRAESHLEAGRKYKDSAEIKEAKIQLAALKMTVTSETPIAYSDKDVQKRFDDLASGFGRAERDLFSATLPSPAPLRTEDKYIEKKVKKIAENYAEIMAKHREKTTKLYEMLTDLNINDVEYRTYKHKLMRGESVPRADKIRELMGLEEEDKKQMETSVLHLAKQKGVTAQTVSKNIGGSVEYNKLNIGLTKLEKGTEIRFRASPRGKEFLNIYYHVTNPQKTTLYLYPDEDLVFTVSGEQIKPDNYTGQTNIEPGKPVEGSVLFIVPDTAKSGVLEFGKKGTQKKRLDVKF